MDDVGLSNYVIGLDHGYVEAGRVTPEISKLLKVEAGSPIWFSDYTLLKLREKHGEITYQHYRIMPHLLLHGFMARSGKKPRHVELWWLDKSGPEPVAFLAVLKAAGAGETFVATFHPLHWREARRLAKKAEKQGRFIRRQPGYEDYRKI